jgi:hypothetical protein
MNNRLAIMTLALGFVSSLGACVITFENDSDHAVILTDEKNGVAHTIAKYGSASIGNEEEHLCYRVMVSQGKKYGAIGTFKQNACTHDKKIVLRLSDLLEGKFDKRLFSFSNNMLDDVQCRPARTR